MMLINPRRGESSMVSRSVGGSKISVRRDHGQGDL